MIPVTEPMTSTVGRNGIAAPLNNTSNTINNAKTLTVVSARALAHFLIVAKISIIWTSFKTNTTFPQWVNYLGQ
jgi:hypothetical protein